MEKSITYKSAGVDINAANEALRRIKKKVHSTFNNFVMRDIGTFGAMYDLGKLLKKYQHPILVQSIDSVGTKLMVASMMGNHKTIGMDMVAHGCNDVLSQGAKPITFLDYIAVPHLKPQHIQEITKGLVRGCKEADIPLIGGEMAELPGMYKKGQYDLVGQVTGVVEKKKIIDGNSIRPGDIILGLASNGLHTNGFSLARKVLPDVKKYFKELRTTAGKELLKPHRCYVKIVYPLLDKSQIKGIAHITGGGLVENIPRILPPDCQAQIQKGSWPVLPIFKLIQKEGDVPEDEMYRTFNMGVGMVLVVSPGEASRVYQRLRRKVGVWEIGMVTKGRGVEFVNGDPSDESETDCIS